MDRRIKLLFTIPNFDTAGSSKVVYDLVKGLDKGRFEISIACKHNEGTLFKEVEQLGVKIYLMDTTVHYRPYYNLFQRLGYLIKFFKEHNFDLIHSWDWSSDWTEVLAARIAGVKWIYTKKAMSWGNKHWKIRSLLADYIITINHEMKNYFPYKKAQLLIPIGIDTEYYSRENVASVNRQNNQFFNIVTVANLVPVKGIEILLRAIHRVNNDLIRLKIVGDNRDPYATKLQQLTKELNLEQQVQFTGKKMDVRPFIKEADVFVIPTLNMGRKEGMPMALVEAMSMGVPVLGSAISGINFVLKEFPELMFDASNDEDLANKLETLRRKGKMAREHLGESLRSYVENNFTMVQFITEHEKLYLKLTS